MLSKHFQEQTAAAPNARIASSSPGPRGRWE